MRLRTTEGWNISLWHPAVVVRAGVRHRIIFSIEHWHLFDIAPLPPTNKYFIGLPLKYASCLLLKCLARRNDLSCHRTSFSLFQPVLPPASRARSYQGCERGSHGTARDARRERRVCSACPKSQPLGCRHLLSTPWTKCGESHFCLIRPAAWRKMIASRCTHVLMWKEFGLLCRL